MNEKTHTTKSTKIVQKENPILRKKADPIPVEHITSKKIQQVIADMKKALLGEKDGAAIAAPQIGVSLRIFVVSHKILSKHTEESDIDEDMVCINPEIIRMSKKKTLMDEGCLSVRGVYGIVPRAIRATLRAYNEKGESFTRGASGLLAQVFQHEIDHLNGTLFIDKAKSVWKTEDKPQK